METYKKQLTATLFNPKGEDMSDHGDGGMDSGSFQSEEELVEIENLQNNEIEFFNAENMHTSKSEDRNVGSGDVSISKEMKASFQLDEEK